MGSQQCRTACRRDEPRGGACARPHRSCVRIADPYEPFCLKVSARTPRSAQSLGVRVVVCAINLNNLTIVQSDSSKFATPYASGIYADDIRTQQQAQG